MSRMPLIVLAFMQIPAMAIGEINITQGPPILNTSKGISAVISCHWNSEDDHQVRVLWRKYMSSTEEENGTELCSLLRNEKSNYSQVRNNKTMCNVTNNTARLTIDGVTEEDEGLYVCEVIIEIPELRRARGSGTRLNVQDYNDNNNALFPRQLVPLLVIVPLVAVVTLIGYILCRRKKKKGKKIPQKRKQEHVEHHQMHQDGAEAEGDSNSSNSVTWALSTLYESFDYFAIRNPGDEAASNLARPDTTEESSLTAI